MLRTPGRAEMRMLSNEQIRRESISRFYLSRRSEEEKDRLMAEILERFSEPGNRFPPERMDELYLLIRKLRDCGYIGCGVDGAFDETYRTTDSGMAYLKSLKKVIGRCGFRGWFLRLHPSLGPEFEPKLSVRTISRLIDEHDMMEEQVRMRRKFKTGETA